MDKNSLKKLINNVISNAIKYGNTNSTISVNLTGSILSIADEGIGIKESKLSEIFDRYRRFTDISGGFGIGLDIVNQVAHEYNIKIDIKSTENKGTTFYFDFSNIA